MAQTRAPHVSGTGRPMQLSRSGQKQIKWRRKPSAPQVKWRWRINTNGDHFESGSWPAYRTKQIKQWHCISESVLPQPQTNVSSWACHALQTFSMTGIEVVSCFDEFNRISFCKNWEDIWRHVSTLICEQLAQVYSGKWFVEERLRRLQRNDVSLPTCFW